MSEINISTTQYAQAVRDDSAFRHADTASSGVVHIGKPQSPPGYRHLTANDGERFLRIAMQANRLRSHFELFQFLQRDVQYFIPHQILISASGDFRDSSLTIDVISAIPGIRTGEMVDCNIDDALRSLWVRWTTHGGQPVLLDRLAVGKSLQPGCKCALHRCIPEMQWALLHGVHDARDGSDSLYLTLNASSISNGRDTERFHLLADPLITQIDVAFRRITALKFPHVCTNQASPPVLGVLSSREEEVLLRVSEGKTNTEIADVLAISPFTVKNHLQQIIHKLNAANRTEAVAIHHQMHRRTNICGDTEKPRDKRRGLLPALA
jgi:transcriptional regulator EpsA